MNGMMKLRSRCNNFRNKSNTSKCLNQILEACCKRKQFRKRKRNPRCPRIDKAHKINRISDQSIIEAIKCIAAATNIPSDTVSLPSDLKLFKTISESSVVRTGTSFRKQEMPRKESIVDLTQSDTTLFSSKWEDSSYTEENYHISRDNIIDELRLRENTPTRNASICTIYPPKSPSLFSTPSDELCVCPLEITRKVTKKRNRSVSDVPCDGQIRVKRLASSRSRLSGTDTDSTDNVWKLKRTYPLNNFACMRKTKSGTSIESLSKMDVDCNLDLMSVSQGFDGAQYDNSALAEDMKCLKVTNNADM